MTNQQTYEILIQVKEHDETCWLYDMFSSFRLNFNPCYEMVLRGYKEGNAGNAGTGGTCFTPIGTSSLLPN